MEEPGAPVKGRTHREVGEPTIMCVLLHTGAVLGRGSRSPFTRSARPDRSGHLRSRRCAFEAGWGRSRRGRRSGGTAAFGRDEHSGSPDRIARAYATTAIVALGGLSRARAISSAKTDRVGTLDAAGDSREQGCSHARERGCREGPIQPVRLETSSRAGIDRVKQPREISVFWEADHRRGETDRRLGIEVDRVEGTLRRRARCRAESFARWPSAPRWLAPVARAAPRAKNMCW